MIDLVVLCLILGYLGVEAGASFPWSAKWQRSRILRRVPEFLITIVLTTLTMVGYNMAGFHTCLSTFILVGAIILGGVEAATWMFLHWTRNGHPDKTRTAKIKPIVDFIAGRFGYELGDEGYSWVAAAVKGFVITAPFGGFGAFLFPLGYEIGSHFPDRYKAIVSEFMSFFGVGVAISLFLLFCGV